MTPRPQPALDRVPDGAGGRDDLTGDPARIVDGLRAWLVSSPASPSGAFHAWLDASSGEPSFEYPEITGYALTHFAGLSDPSDEEVRAGLRAGNWLARRLETGDLSAREGWEEGAVYSFDLAMIATGLLAFGHRFQVGRLVDNGLRLAELVRDLIDADGRLAPVDTRLPQAAWRRSWSTLGHAHLLKVVQCLLWADRLEAAGCREAASRLISTSPSVEREDGRFETDPDDDDTMLHAHCYALSGLWIYGRATGDRGAIDRARRAVEWVWRQQLGNGGFPRTVPTARSGGDGRGIAVEQTDVTAQAICAALTLGMCPDGLRGSRGPTVPGRGGDGRRAVGAALPTVVPDTALQRVDDDVRRPGARDVAPGHAEDRVGPPRLMGTRVCVVGSGSRFLSGISYYTHRVATAVASSHDVSVILMRGLIPTRFYPGRDRVGVPLARFRYPEGMPVFDGVDWYSPASVVKAAAFLRRQRPDVVVLQWWTGAVLHSYLVLAAIARLGGSRLVVEFHEVQDTGERGLPLAGAYVKLMLPLLLRLAHGAVVHSEFDLGEIRQRYGRLARHVAVIPHGPYDGYADDGETSIAGNGSRASDDPCHLLYFGVIRPFKGLEDLLAAFEAIPEDEIGGYRLTIVGETWEGWDLPATMVAASRHRDRITFVNRYVTDEEVSRVFRSADAVVLPYHRASSSGPLHLTMAHGLPVIVTAVGGLVEAAEGYGGTHFVPPRDPAAIRAALPEVAARRESRFVDPHSWSRTAARYDELFNAMKVTEGRRPDPVPDGFEPIRLVEVEITEPIPPVRSDGRSAGVRRYGRAHSLVRLHGAPLGVVDVDLCSNGTSSGGVTAEEHAEAIWTSLRAEAAAHLRADGLAAPDRLHPSGLDGGERPACERPRDELLVDPPTVSVVIPTRERPELLRRCLEAILAGDYPNDRLQVLVVDNRPVTDGTRCVVDELSRELPVTYLREDRSGSASARNRGLAVARGEIVAFTDDDAVVDRRWLTQLVLGFHAADDVACVTGLLLPGELETPAQVWFEEYGGFTRGFERRIYDLDEHRPADQPLYPYSAGIFGTGNNMAFARDALVEIGGFDPALGNGTPALGGVDSEVLLRTVVTGHRLVYEPSALAYHVHRPGYAALRRQIYGYGVGTSAYLLKTLLGNPGLLPDFARKLPRGLVFALSPGAERNLAKRPGFPRELTLLELLGMARGPLAYARSRRRYGRHPDVRPDGHRSRLRRRTTPSQGDR